MKARQKSEETLAKKSIVEAVTTKLNEDTSTAKKLTVRFEEASIKKESDDANKSSDEEYDGHNSSNSDSSYNKNYPMIKRLVS